jgi:hypothetical protein
VEEALSLVSDFPDVAREMVVLEVRGVRHDVLELATAEEMSVYDE